MFASRYAATRAKGHRRITVYYYCVVILFVVVVVVAHSVVDPRIEFVQ